MLMASLLLSLFLLIDNGTSYTYLQTSYEEQVAANKVLGKLIVKAGSGYTQKDILYLLRQEYPDELIVEENGKIVMGPNSFEFKNGQLIKAK